MNPNQTQPNQPLNPFQNMMNTVKQDPNSDYAKAVFDNIRGGKFNDLAKQYGYDLTPFNTPKPQPQPQAQQNPDFFQRVANDLIGRSKNIVSDVTAPAEAMNQGASPLSVGVKLGEAGLRTAGNVAGGAFNILNEAVHPILNIPIIKDTIQRVGKEFLGATNILGETNAQTLDRVNNFMKANPNLTKDTGAVMNILGVLGLNQTELKMTGGKGIPQAFADKTATGMENLRNIPSKIGGAMQEKYTNQSLEDWKTPASTNKASFKKATQIYDNASAKGHDIADTLVKNGIKLSDNVESGKYATSDTADSLRADAGKASSDLLRPALEVADQTTPKTQVSDIVDSAIKDIQSSRGETPGNIESQIAKVKAEGAALERKYPDGMSLTDMHDNKISYANNGGYKPIGTVEDNNLAAANRSLGRTLASQVETKAPSDIPVKEFNAELQKQYQAADYLDSLHTKNVPKSIMSNIAKTTAKVTGAAVGHAVGGGILGGVGGYHIGGMLETMVEDMPNPIKNFFLNKLETSNPEAFQAIQDYLKNFAQSGSVK